MYCAFCDVSPNPRLKIYRARVHDGAFKVIKRGPATVRPYSPSVGRCSKQSFIQQRKLLIVGHLKTRHRRSRTPWQEGRLQSAQADLLLGQPQGGRNWCQYIWQMRSMAIAVIDFSRYPSSLTEREAISFDEAFSLNHPAILSEISLPELMFGVLLWG